MVNAIIETSLLVDYLRGYAPCVQWLQRQDLRSFAITPIIWMELVEGAPNRVAARHAAELAGHFQMSYLIQEDFDWAIMQQATYRLSHGVGMMDCLIASVSYRLQRPLINAKFETL